MLFFFFNDTATTEIYTLSLHDALPISHRVAPQVRHHGPELRQAAGPITLVHQLADERAVFEYPVEVDGDRHEPDVSRSEEHTSELQSRLHLVCRLLLEKKKNTAATIPP